MIEDGESEMHFKQTEKNECDLFETLNEFVNMLHQSNDNRAQTVPHNGIQYSYTPPPSLLTYTHTSSAMLKNNR